MAKISFDYFFLKFLNFNFFSYLMSILYIFYYEKCAQDRIWDYAYFEFFLHIFENSEISFVLTSFMHY